MLTSHLSDSSLLDIWIFLSFLPFLYKMLPTTTKARDIYEFYIPLLLFQKQGKKLYILGAVGSHLTQHVFDSFYFATCISELCNSASKPNHSSDISGFHRSHCVNFHINLTSLLHQISIIAGFKYSVQSKHSTTFTWKTLSCAKKDIIVGSLEVLFNLTW